jgi:4-hydroxy-tetrahydrodipicolinate synthase
VPVTVPLIERLLKRYPRAIAGAKDSSGNWANSKTMIENFAREGFDASEVFLSDTLMIENFAREGFDVFPASEVFLSDTLAIGGAGCISATVNINPAAISGLFRALNADRPSHETRALQARVDEVRRTLQSFELIPAMKSVVAHYTGCSAWKFVRPPLTSLDQSAEADLLKKLASLQFEMPVAQ